MVNIKTCIHKGQSGIIKQKDYFQIFMTVVLDFAWNIDGCGYEVYLLY